MATDPAPLPLSLAQARDYAADVLIRHGASVAAAGSVAHALVAAEADGLGGHGLSRLSSYAQQLKAGKVRGSAIPAMTQPRAAVLLVDAAEGFAYPAIDLAIAELIDATRSEGLAVAAIRRSHHCGAMGLHVERLAREGFAALMVANTPSAMAPWGGDGPLFGTNPIAFAAPAPGREPVVIDLSLSKVARGNIMAAKQKGQPIPEGWAFDAQGRPTTDADAALAGTMAPMGDAKGVTLALMVELLAACLTGAVLSKDATSFLDAKGGPPGTGQLLLAFDATLLSGGLYGARTGALIAAIEAQSGARLPGVRRLANRAKAARDGVVVGVALQRELAAL